jgi:hypothetical protein
MARRLTIASAQMAPISRPETRNYKCVQAIKQERHKGRAVPAEISRGP